MSARQIRRAFAAPFVVTLGASMAIGAAGCSKKPSKLHQNPPVPHQNPPAPPKNDEPAPTPTTTDPAPAPAPGPTAAIPEKPEIIHRNPPPPDAVDNRPKEPAKVEYRWTVMKTKGQADCQAFLDSSCPKPEAGKPIPPCNPPPPIKYVCPDGFKDGDTLKIVLRVGATECFVDRGPMKCPAGVRCNPPPPRKLACPS